MAGTAKQGLPLTSARQSGSIVMLGRDVMRKDKAPSGEFGRLPTRTWVMFAKILDEMERAREEEAALAGERFALPSSSPTVGAIGQPTVMPACPSSLPAALAPVLDCRHIAVRAIPCYN